MAFDDTTTVYAVAGERIFCDGGHPIARLAVTVYKHAPPRSDKFKDWIDGERPAYGQSYRDCVCKRCGAPWIKFSAIGGAILKIEGEWRTDHPEDFRFMSEISG